jgi:hypothetical protein
VRSRDEAYRRFIKSPGSRLLLNVCIEGGRTCAAEVGIVCGGLEETGTCVGDAGAGCTGFEEAVGEAGTGPELLFSAMLTALALELRCRYQVLAGREPSLRH